MLKKLLLEEEAQGMVEYILIIAIVAVAGIAILNIFGDRIRDWFNRTGENLDEAIPD